MGMTIEEAERLLNNHLDGVTNYCERELTDKAIQVAIETMRKYQKIVEIMADKKDDGGVFKMEDSYWLDKISEVLNGTDNSWCIRWNFRLFQEV